MKKNIYLVLDTETFSTDQIPMEVSWKAIDSNGCEIFKRAYVVKEVFFNRKGNVHGQIKFGKFSADKFQRYLDLIDNGTMEVASISQIREQFMADCSTGLKTTITAYNSNFDSNALDNLMYYGGYTMPFTYFEWHDLWNLTCNCLLNTTSYAKFVVENSFYTDIPNAKTSAEIAYRYISGNTSFIETHFAFEDIDIEAALLVKCLQSKKKLKWDGNTWRIPQEKFKKVLAKGQEKR